MLLCTPPPDVLNVPQSPGGVGKSPSRRMQLQQKLSSPQRRWELDSEKSRQLLDEKLVSTRQLALTHWTLSGTCSPFTARLAAGVGVAEPCV